MQICEGEEHETGVGVGQRIVKGEGQGTGREQRETLVKMILRLLMDEGTPRVVDVHAGEKINTIIKLIIILLEKCQIGNNLLADLGIL